MKIVSDFSRTLFHPKDPAYTDGLNPLNKALQEQHGADYDIFEYFEFNKDLMEYYRSLKGQYSVSVFTTDVIQNHVRVRPLLEEAFEHIFSANELGLNKQDPESYRKIAGMLEVQPEEVVYVDDQPKNLNPAREAGMIALHFTGDNAAIITEIESALGKRE